MSTPIRWIDDGASEQDYPDRGTWWYVRLAWAERHTDVTTHEAGGVPAYETTRYWLLRAYDWRFALLGY